MTKALYRRYRPETFQEVIGQEHVIKPLMAALAAGNTTHAYLFSGPRGCGKTTSARILARCLNCAEYPTDTPCGQCDSCRELSRDGSGSLDVVELDAASHGGVDDARELREQAGFAPVRDRFKIYIIDEAHMVSNQGFNALLKLVEEPPPHVKFIFATTEPEKVIDTIRSRTHHYPFRLVPPAVLEDYLTQVCEREGVQAGRDVLSLVVRAGTGSVRDTLSVLDQLIGGSQGNVLEYERAVALLGYTSAHLLDEAVAAIAARDGAALFTVVDEVVKSGHDPRRFVEDLLQRLRDVVIIALAGDSVKDVFLSVPDDQYALMVSQAGELGAARASRAADLVNEALTAMVGATAPRMQLELLCARLIVADELALAQASSSARNFGAAGVSGAVMQIRATPAGSTPSGMPNVSSETPRESSGTPSASSGVPSGASGGVSARAEDGAAPALPRPALADPRRQPMPSFTSESSAVTPEPAAAASARSVAAPADATPADAAIPPQSAAEADNRAAAPQNDLPVQKQTQKQAQNSAQGVRGRESGARDAVTHETRATRETGSAQLDQIQSAWARIMAAASAESKIVGNMLKHASGPLTVDDELLVMGFADEGTAAGFNHNKRAQAALAHSIEQAMGISLRVEGRVGTPTADAHPKGDSGAAEPSGFAANADTLGLEDAPDTEEAPELDPVYGFENDSDEADPAGVLSQLLDVDDESADEEIPTDEETESAPAETAELALTEPASAQQRPHSSQRAQAAVSENPAEPAEPFFAQDMPAPPPTHLPPSFAKRYAAMDAERSASAESGVAAAPDSVAERWVASLVQDSSAASHNSSVASGAAHAGGGQAGDIKVGDTEEQQFDDPWDEVSPDDPEISSSSLVGLNVVLDTFPGSEVVEILDDASDRGYI